MPTSIKNFGLLRLWLVTGCLALTVSSPAAKASKTGVPLSSECEELESEAKIGSADAQYYLAECLYRGSPTDEDRAAALYWLEESANSGNAKAKNSLAAIWLFKTEDKSQHRLAVKHLETAWLAGVSQAGTNLGIAYLAGRGVDRRTATGIDWLRRAAETGDVLANLILYSSYRFGYLGMEIRPSEAERYWTLLSQKLEHLPRSSVAGLFQRLPDDDLLNDYVFTTDQLEAISSDALARLNSGLEK